MQTDAPTFCRIVQIRKQIQSAVAYKYQTIPTPLCTQREAHVQNIYNYLTLHMYIYIYRLSTYNIDIIHIYSTISMYACMHTGNVMQCDVMWCNMMYCGVMSSSVMYCDAL